MTVVAVMSTYNEAGALPDVVNGLRRAIAGVRIVVVDDDSPDKTADIARTAGVDVIVRRGVPRGRGLSGRAGYLRALELGASAILELDADGSHDPVDAPKILAALERADIAIGSRAGVCGGADERGRFRRSISLAAKGFIRIVLGLTLEDPTSGYRAFRSETLRKIDPASLTSRGPEIVEEVYVRARRLGLTMVEIPITFRDRVAGVSKLTAGRLLSVLWRCVRLAARS